MNKSLLSQLSLLLLKIVLRTSKAVETRPKRARSNSRTQRSGIATGRATVRLACLMNRLRGINFVLSFILSRNGLHGGHGPALLGAPWRSSARHSEQLRARGCSAFVTGQGEREPIRRWRCRSASSCACSAIYGRSTEWGRRGQACRQGLDAEF